MYYGTSLLPVSVPVHQWIDNVHTGDHLKLLFVSSQLTLNAPAELVQLLQGARVTEGGGKGNGQSMDEGRLEGLQNFVGLCVCICAYGMCVCVSVG